MSILDSLLGKRKGWDCRPNPDGTAGCRRFIVEKNGKVASGTEVTIGADPKNNCEPFLTGDVNSILDDEAADIDKISKRVSASCRRGMN